METVKRARKKRTPSVPKPGVVRIARIGIFLNRGYYQYAHDAAHECGLLWNTLVTWVRGEWSAGRKPSERDIRDHADSLNKTIPLHSHTIQAVAKDLYEAIQTSRTNRRLGLKGRAPWREVQYRPLTFSARCGWRITPEGKLALSFGQGVKRILLPKPVIIDPLTGLPVPDSMWGEAQLCWNRNARTWFLHIAYHTEVWNGVPQAVPDENGNYPEGTIFIGVDEGLKVAMALSCKQDNNVDILIINGKALSSAKRYRNKTNGQYDKRIKRCKNGSRKQKRLVASRKKTNAKTDRIIENLNHNLTAKAEVFIREQSLDKKTGELRPVALGVGDVAGIQKNTRKQRRLNRRMRQPISQWSRGKQERMLGYKTGLTLVKVPEYYTTQACPKCSTKNKVRNRNYECRNPECGFTMHRDGVGSGNISSRLSVGGVGVSKDTPIAPWVDDDTNIVVTYQRAVHYWTPVQSGQHSHYDALRGRIGVGVGKHVVEDPNRSRTKRKPRGSSSMVAGQVVTSTPNQKTH